MITTEAVRAWCLVSGEWVEREDPVMAVCDPYGGDVRAAMAALGYEVWCQVGVGDLPSVPVSLAVYSREAPPLQFLLQLEGNAGNVVEHIFAETLPDAMELLARWAPIARTGSHDARVRVARAEDRSRLDGDVPGRLEDVLGHPEDDLRCPEEGTGHAGERPRPAGDGTGDAHEPLPPAGGTGHAPMVPEHAEHGRPLPGTAALTGDRDIPEAGRSGHLDA